LEFGDVFASHHGRGLIQQAVAEHETGFYDRSPGLVGADPIRLETTRDLEEFYRSSSLFGEEVGVLRN
jgi:hypothetical protein